MTTDKILWALLTDDLLTAMAEDALPPPPRTPRFAAETTRPQKKNDPN